MDECTYVDGVVFRKSVSHKKMMVAEVRRQSESSNDQVCIAYLKYIIVLSLLVRNNLNR